MALAFEIVLVDHGGMTDDAVANLNRHSRLRAERPGCGRGLA